MRYGIISLAILVVTFLSACGGSGETITPETPAAAKANMIASHSAARATAGEVDFIEITYLNAVAQTHADYMASIGVSSKTDGDGKSIAELIAEDGVVGLGTTDLQGTSGTTAAFWATLYGNPTVLAVITDPQYLGIGVGVTIVGTKQFWCIIYADDDKAEAVL